MKYTKQYCVTIKNLIKDYDNIDIEDYIKNEYGDKCYIDGFILKDTIRISYISVPYLEDETLIYQVKFNCDCINISEGEHIECIIKDKTKVGYEVKTDYSIGYILKEFIDDSVVLDIGDKVIVEVLTYKYKLDDTQLTFIGKYINKI